MLPSGSDLTYFMAVAQHGSLTKAANRLGIAQPSLTLAMQRLEHNVGTALFLRSRSGVSLTKAGERLLSESRDLLQHWEQLTSKALSTTNEVRGRFVLGCHPAVAAYSLPLFLPRVLHDNPALEIRLEHDLSRAITRKVVDLEVDIAIVVNPTSHPDLVMKDLARDEVTLWRTPKLLNPDSLIVEPSLIQTQDLLRRLGRHGLKFARVMECSSLEVIARLAAAGTGVAILPARVAHGAAGPLKAVEGAPKFHDVIRLIYRTEHRNVRAIQALAKAIQDGFR